MVSPNRVGTSLKVRSVIAMKPRSGKILPIVLSLGAVIAVVGINGMASKNSPTSVDVSSPETTAPEAPRVQPDFQRSPQDASKYVRELARRSQGKYESLNAEDRRYLDVLTAGHGKEMLASNWKNISQEKKPADEAPVGK